MHTWDLESEKQFIQNKPIDYIRNNNDHKLLNPNYFNIDYQNEYIKNINPLLFNKQFPQKKWHASKTNLPDYEKRLFINFLCSLESKNDRFT